MIAPQEFMEAQLITLRRASPSDCAALFAFSTDPLVMHFMDWPIPASINVTRSVLQENHAAWDAGTEFQWVILERLSGEVAGTISCRPKGDAADFGYFLGQKYWGRGLAFEACSAVLGWLDAQPRISRIWATADAENSRSRRLLERLGLQLEAVKPHATLRPNIGGSPRDTAVYARIKTDN